MTSTRGFTLIEILVAVAIFGLLSIAAYTVLDSGMRSREQAELRLSHLAELQRLFYTINTDLNYLVPRRTRNDLGDVEAIMSGHSDISGEDFSLKFNRGHWRNPAGFRRSHLQHVEYWIEEQQVFRRHRVYLDMAPNSPEIDRMMASQVSAIRIQFQNKDKQWTDEWGQFSEQADQLPMAVRIQVTSDLFGEIERYFLVTQYSLTPERDESDQGQEADS